MGAASGLFYHQDRNQETLNKRVRPSDEQIEFLRENKDEAQAYLTADLSERCGCPVSTWLQGSYKFHTLIRPVHKTGSYDVDVGIYLEWTEEDGELYDPVDLRGHLEAALYAFKRENRSVKSIEDPPKERCSRTHYDKQFHIDTPAYHHDPITGVVRLATLTHGWEYSDPEKMVAWFQERLDGAERAQVRRLTRYLKAWAALAFKDNNDAMPSSLLLTVLSVDAYAAVVGRRVLGDDDALKSIVESIFWRLSGSRNVQNPVGSDQDRDLNRLNDAGFDTFMRSLYGLVDIATRACACEEEAEAAAIWTEAFDYLLPLPDITGIAEEDGQRGIMVATPRMRIDISAALGGPSIRTFHDQVDLVRLKQWLRFTIVNPEVLPPGAQVRWVVRNVGDQAYSENDLGHSELDSGGLTHDETAAYDGRHFLDCEVRVNGRLRSVTRVPVLITAVQVPPRHPARPAYAKLRRGR